MKTKKGLTYLPGKKTKVNDILGTDKAQYIVRFAIARKYIPKQETWIQNTPNWDSIEKAVTAKFGPLGQEAVYGRRMTYSSDIKKIGIIMENIMCYIFKRHY